MNLTTAQKQTFQTWLNNNAAGLSDTAAAALANTLVVPTYWCWRTTVPITDIYNLTDDQAGAWDWTNYQSQSVTQQGAWTQMGIFQQQVYIAQQNIRNGILAIFGNTGAGKTNRDHCYAVGRRAVTNFEQLFVAAVVNPPINTGNDGVAGNRGLTTNPDNLGVGADGKPVEGFVTAQFVSDIRGGIA